MTFPVHPAADVWPMLPDDELRALADSIADVGLLEPIVLTPDGLLLDGRNRAAACQLNGWNPETVVYDGDPVAYVLARNETRRHMTKGQRAMAAWETIATDEVRYGQMSEIANELRLTTETLRQARVVSVHAPDLVLSVTVGARSLKDAYDEARKRRDDANTEQAKLDNLPDDLAAQVREETLTLDEAMAAAEERAKRTREQHRDATSLLTRVLDLLAAGERNGGEEFIDAWLDHLQPVDHPDAVGARIDDGIRILTHLAKGIRS